MSEKQLLDHLLSSGITPSFAFPLDTAVFKGEGRDGRQKKIVWPNMQADLKLALSQYSPGRVLTVDNKKYKVEGLYFYDYTCGINRAESAFRNAWNSPEEGGLFYYNRCKDKFCQWVSAELNAPDSHEVCPVCHQEDTTETKRWFRPDGFAPQIIPQTRQGKNSERETPRQWNMGPKAINDNRQLLPAGGVQLPAPLDGDGGFETLQIDDIPDDLSEEDFILLNGFMDRIQIKRSNIDSEGIELIVINAGFSGQGYYVCNKCGLIHLLKNVAQGNQAHHRPYTPDPSNSDISHEAEQLCTGEILQNQENSSIYLGMTFRTDMILFSLSLTQPFSQLRIRDRELNSGFISVKEAILTEMEKVMGFASREIAGGIRKRKETRDDEENYFIEFFLYDDVSGGAGLTTSMLNENKETWSQFARILRNAEKRLSGDHCIDEKGCQKSCIHCLLDFRNRKDENILDRKNGLILLRYMMYGTIPSLESANTDQCNELEDISLMLKDRLNDTVNDDNKYETSIEDERLILITKNDKTMKIRIYSSMIDQDNDIWISNARNNENLDIKNLNSTNRIDSCDAYYLSSLQIKENSENIISIIQELFNPTRQKKFTRG